MPQAYLTNEEVAKGCNLLVDTGTDTRVTGKHAWVVEIIKGFLANMRGFDDSTHTLENLPIVNVKYAFDVEATSETIILELNHCIYLGSKKTDSILCPNQLRMNGIYIDERPSALFPGLENTQCIIGDGTKMDLMINGPLMTLSVRRPSLTEITDDNIQVITLTSPHGWDPYGDDSVSSYSIRSLMRVVLWGNPSITSMLSYKGQYLRHGKEMYHHG